METGKICVLGAGSTGAGIARVAAAAGFEVALQDIDEGCLKKALDSVRQDLGEEAESIMARIKTSASPKDAAGDAALVIEALPEDMQLKQKVLKEAESVCPENAIIATTTGTLSISGIASALKKKERCLGMHFYYPVPETNLVELVFGEETSEKTLETAKTMVEKMGRTPARMKESPLHIMNRTMAAIVNEACFMAMEGLAEIPDIDNAMKLGTNWPKGPFEFADEIGLDTVLSYLELLLKEIGETKYRPCPFLRKKVRAGHLGKKVGQGFYKY
jgi:3-hydroxybutyryl-CoA dehydrogenase